MVQPTRLYSKGLVLGYRRSLKAQTRNTSLIRIEGVDSNKSTGVSKKAASTSWLGRYQPHTCAHAHERTRTHTHLVINTCKIPTITCSEERERALCFGVSCSHPSHHAHADALFGTLVFV